MRTEATYIAFDGTKFNDETECYNYEKENINKRLSSDCAIFDSDGTQLSLKEFFSDPEQAYIIYAPSYNDAKIIHEICINNSTFSPWEDNFIAPGLYCFIEKWINLSKILRPFLEEYEEESL